MKALIIIISIFFFISCGSDLRDEINSEEIPTKAEYDLTITNKTTGEITRLVATDVNTTWSIEKGFIFLSTDRMLENQPIGPVSMSVGSYPDDEGEVRGFTSSIAPGGLVSKTDKRRGTSAELNARTFEIVSGNLINIDANSAFIRGTIDTCVLKRIFIPNGESEEVASIKGTFTALRDN